MGCRVPATTISAPPEGEEKRVEQGREDLSVHELELLGLVLAKKPARDIASGMALDFLELGQLMRALWRKRPAADDALSGLRRLTAREWDVLLLAVDGGEVEQM